MNKLRVIVDNDFNIEIYRGELMSNGDYAHAMWTLKDLATAELNKMFPLVADTPFNHTNKAEPITEAETEVQISVQGFSPSIKQSSSV
jgi:hypothetical protein